MSTSNDEQKWLGELEYSLEQFANKHQFTYSKSQRQIAASFEIGCLLALASFYERQGTLFAKNLKNGEFRYLTTPAGIPDNFSFLEVDIGGAVFAIRQQVRIRSHLDTDIAFTPDIVVIPGDIEISETRDADYGNGRMRFCYVDSEDVVAAHECKSMQPFPELFISFVGVLVVAHGWYDPRNPTRVLEGRGPHLAPTLFVGGSARALHNRMAGAMRKSLPLNVVVGLHRNTWSLKGRRNRLPRDIAVT